MQLTSEQINPTKFKFTITCDPKTLARAKKLVVNKLGQNVKVPGFREGSAPASVVEKHIDQNTLQSEFINEAVLSSYEQAVLESKVRVIGQPQISITKFVPYSQLEFTAETEAVSDIKLGKYSGLNIKKPVVSVRESDVARVLDDLASRGAKRSVVKRTVKDGDEVNIDFKGVDAKTKVDIAGADAKNYDLVIGSHSFIPGFEEELVGAKAGEVKNFELTFPKDYGVETLKNKKVSFKVTLNSIKQIEKAKIDDKLASSVGPFKTLAELKKNIKEQLILEKDKAAQDKVDNDLLSKIAESTEVEIPNSLVEEEMDRIEEEERRNLVYRGQTWQEHLDSEGITNEEHRERQRPIAAARVKTGLVLGAIADKEKITVSESDLTTRLNLLKKNYSDEAMLAELDKPENIRDIRSRLMVENTLAKIRELN